MSQVARISPYVHALDEDDGATRSPDADGYVTLGVDTYFFPIGGSDSPTVSAQIQTDAAIAGAFSVESTNAPKEGRGSASDWDDSATSPWTKDDSTVNAFVQSNGTGWSATELTLTKTAGAGNAIINLHGRGGMRYRVRADVTTGGNVRVSTHSKTG